MALRQFTITDKQGKKKKIAFDPSDISLIEQIDNKSCNVVVKINDVDIIYLVQGTFKQLYNTATLSEFGFMEN